MNCVDKKGCEDAEFVTLPCFYEEPKQCNESWSCSEWGVCFPNGTQLRSCFDDNQCDTNYTLPALAQECDYIGTCSDGIKNCHDGACEEGIDCSGPCNLCKSVQVPYPFQDEGGIWIYMFTGLLMLLLMSILVYHYFRKEINATLAKMAWFINRKKRKQYLLSKEDQKVLMAALLDLEKKLLSAKKKEELYDTLNRYGEIVSVYFMKVLNLEGDLD